MISVYSLPLLLRQECVDQKILHLVAEDKVVTAHDKEGAECMKTLMDANQRWGSSVNILKAEGLNIHIGSDTQNMEIADNIEMKVTKAFKVLKISF
jgi:hypothetical protein